MPTFDQDDTFLARWLNNELTEAERAAFEQSAEYTEFKRIAVTAQELRTPEYDQATAWDKLQQSTSQSTAVIRSLRRWWAMAAAIALLLVAGTTWYWTGFVTISTLAQAQERIELPDGSVVTLNSQSNLTYNQRLWSWQREIELDGEAFFDVEPGSSFTTTTPSGIVEVLGTTFNVYSRRARLEVHCLTGQVAVTNTIGNTRTILNPQEAICLHLGNGDKETFSDSTAPSWQSGTTTYQSATLGRVLDDIEDHFAIQFTRTGIDTEQRFTGAFLHNDVDVALDMVLAPLGIRYERSGQRVLLQ